MLFLQNIITSENEKEMQEMNVTKSKRMSSKVLTQMCQVLCPIEPLLLKEILMMGKENKNIIWSFCNSC
ncbi:hypothetical protein JCM10512_2477 [Bacteroides reticulotermitis JCM 10512]|uniref:Uncharacterized protein n=1 Tax=Bacteroides reticulotermitis JCM 10512 TaxID=1445607 RepID=W4USG2_9BACE|nr:hypothetical protein JCM10512_2477 [Bacteroides reticulotermitis JCM 10512]